MGTYFESVPNVTTVEGSDEERLVTQKLEVTDRGVRLLCRGGVMGGPRDIDLGFDDIVGVEQGGEYTYELVIRTGENTYTVTNVTSNAEEIRGVVEFIRGRIGGVQGSRTASAGTGETPSSSGEPSSDGGADAAAATNGGGADDTADVTERLRRFADLRDEGILTDEEFERKKQQLLESEEW